MGKFLFDDDSIAKHVRECTKTDTWAWDTQTSGLGLRVRCGDAGQSVTWYVGYTIHGDSRRDPIGKFSDLKLEDARNQVYELRRDLGKIDPRAEKAKREAEATSIKTLREASEAFLAKFVGRPNTRRAHERYLRGSDLNPSYFVTLLDKPIKHITRAQISERLNVITKGSSKHVAKQARTSLLMVYRFACGEGWVDNIDVVAGTHDPSPKKGQTPRQRKLSDAELVTVWQAAPALIKLLILTGCRREEVGALCWSEIHDAWYLPASRTKTNEARTIPLSPAVRAILAGIEVVPQRDRVFGPIAWSRVKAQLPALDTPWTLHDLRRTMRSGLSRLGISDEIAEHCIGHKRELLIRTYSVDERLEQQAKAFDLWAAHVEGLVNGSTVVSIRSSSSGGSVQCQ